MKRQKDEHVYTAEVTLRDVHYDTGESQISWKVQILRDGSKYGLVESGAVDWPWDTVKDHANKTARRMLSAYNKPVREEKFVVE